MRLVLFGFLFFAAGTQGAVFAQEFNTPEISGAETHVHRQLVEQLRSENGASQFGLRLNENGFAEYTFPTPSGPQLDLVDPNAALRRITTELLATGAVPQTMRTDDFRSFSEGTLTDSPSLTDFLVDLGDEQISGVSDLSFLQLAEQNWLNPDGQADLQLANTYFMQAYEINPESGPQFLEFLQVEPQLDPGRVQALTITRNLSQNGDPAATFSLYADFNVLSGVDALRVFREQGFTISGGYAGDIILDLYPSQIDNALEAYSAAANTTPYATAQFARLSRDNPNSENALPPELIQAALEAAARQGDSQAFVGLLEQPISRTETYEILAQSDGLPHTEEQLVFRNEKANFVCPVNTSVADCPTLPMFFVTDRRLSKTQNQLAFENVVSNAGIYMGLSEIRVLSNTQISSRILNMAEIAYQGWCGEGTRRFCSDRKQLLGISTPVIATPTNEIDQFVREVAEYSAETGLDRLVIYIHGFNNDFSTASQRFANLMEKARYPAVPILFSFASLEKSFIDFDSNRGLFSLAYNKDLDISGQSCARFRPVMDALIARFGADNIDLFAHSMGANITLDMALGCPRATSENGGQQTLWEGRQFRSVVLAAPDISKIWFTTNYEAFRDISERMTFYVTTNDLTMEASNFANGTDSRLGQANPDDEVYLGSQTVDATGVEYFDGSTIKNHSYVFLVGAVRLDVAALLNGFFEASFARCINAGSKGGSYYYIIPRCNE